MVCSTKAFLPCCQIKSTRPAFFNHSQMCPLDIDEVLSQGIRIRQTEDVFCELQIGGELSGIIVKELGGPISLE
jgi:hypothetical protein